MKLFWISLVFLLGAVCAQAQSTEQNLAALLPANDEEAGWRQTDWMQSYHGEDLFQMIDGGAEIFHEYGFVQVLATEYADRNDRTIKLEIYEMESPAAAYGMYSFMGNGVSIDTSIGQATTVEDYYLVFWKGKLLVTLIGMVRDEATSKGVLALAKSIDKHYEQTGKRPELAELMLSEPSALSGLKYIRGDLGVLNNYIFDTENIFKVQEGVIGKIQDCQVFVFLYANEEESSGVYNLATEKLSVSSRYRERSKSGKSYSMLDRDNNFVEVNLSGNYIVVLIANELATVTDVSKQVIGKIKN